MGRDSQGESKVFCEELKLLGKCFNSVTRRRIDVLSKWAFVLVWCVKYGLGCLFCSFHLLILTEKLKDAEGFLLQNRESQGNNVHGWVFDVIVDRYLDFTKQVVVMKIKKRVFGFDKRGPWESNVPLLSMHFWGVRNEYCRSESGSPVSFLGFWKKATNYFSVVVWT